MDLNLNHDSLYKKLAGKTVKWLPSDTDRQYRYNLEKNYDQLKINGWVDHPGFTYSFNKYGFRCSDFSDEPTAMFLGCSNTLGTGIPENDRWSDIVANTLNLKCANLGIGGSSLDTAFRLCHGWLDKINPKIVILRRPPGIRFELVTAVNQQHFAAWPGPNDSLYKLWAQDNNNAEFNAIKNISAIEYMCFLRKIKFVDLKSFYKSLPSPDLGRDLIHPGIKCNKLFAEKALSSI